MQTFLPYSSFEESAKCLDYKRLGKQRVEASQILTALLFTKLGEKYGWQNHPAVKMWTGFENALNYYRNCMIKEWISRGYNNTMKLGWVDKEIIYPSFIGNYAFHEAHRSNLLRKDPVFYGKYNWGVPDDLPYIWF